MDRRVVLGWIALFAAAGCSRSHAPTPEPQVEAGATGATTVTGSEVAGDAGPAAPEERAQDKGPMLYAFAQVAPIFSAPEWPAKDPQHAADDRKGVIRLGYFRPGERLAIKEGEPSKKNCAEGWYELVQGGFVCGKYATSDPKAKELKYVTTHAPYMDRILPYDYGLNLTPGTPLYRRIPKKAERKEYEKTLAVGKGKKASDVAKELKESGQELPSYLKNVDQAKPSVAFDELKGDELVATRMLRGFYISLDKPIEAWSGNYWRTASGLITPKDHIKVHETKTEFEGVELAKAGQTIKIPFAYVIGTRGHKYTFTDDKDPERGDKLERFTVANLTGQRKTRDNKVYHETDQGYWLRGIDIAVVKAPKAPGDLTAGEKWIDVDLRDQSLVAMEGDKAVYATIVSTGRKDPDDPEKDHRTPEGTFRIREKHVTVTMDDDAASDGTYRIEDVPWVMYFEKGVALHGAFWHSSFGRERSHGCVNLQPFDAKHLFEWAGPKLPEGWHGVASTKENPGTRVIVHR